MKTPTVPAGARPARALVFTLTVRRTVRSGALWGAALGLITATSALSYDRVYPTHALRLALARAFGSNTMTIALFGPAPHLDTVAGFTSFKVSLTLSVLASLWGLRAATGALRGEEETGRWDLLLAGPRRRVATTAQALAGVGVGVVVLAATCALVTTAAIRSPASGLRWTQVLGLGGAVLAAATTFAALGALTSQLDATRHDATTTGVVVLAIAYALRLVADAGLGLHALVWASPLGWVEEMAPLTAPSPVAAVPVAIWAIVLGAAALRGARVRDVGAGLLARDDRRRRRRRLLTGPGALTWRLGSSTILRWWIGITLGAGLIGLVARKAGSTIGGSSVRDVFSRLGATTLGTRAVLGVASLILAVVVSLLAVGQVAAARAEEARGHLDWLVASRVSRVRWLLWRLGAAAIALGGVGLLEGLATWGATASQGAHVGPTLLLEAGANLLPPALTLLGVATALYGLWPRAAVPVSYGLVAWSLLIVIVGGIGAISPWLLDTSVFHHMAAAPAEAPHAAANAIMCAIGLVGIATGVVAFARRDLVAT